MNFVLGSLAGLLLTAAVAASAIAEITVIHDSGETQPLAPYLRPMQVEKPRNSRVRNTLPLPSVRAAADRLRLPLPLRSEVMHSGPYTAPSLAAAVAARLRVSNPQPFFLLGSEARSLEWLAQHHETLQALGAVGLLVQAETEDDVRRIAAIAPELPISLGSGDDLAEVLGIRVYPVLVTGEGIRQ